MSFLKNIDHSKDSDQELVKQYKKDGDIQVLARLFKRYMDMLYAVCLKYLKEPEAAKDAVMGLFEELIVKLRRHEVNHFKGWVYMVARNHCLMQLRTEKKIPVVHQPDLMHFSENLHLEDVFEKEEHLNQLTKCLDTLSPEQKHSVQLFYLQEKCYKEIAGITNTDWNNVRSLIQNARRNLKICMEKNMSAGK